MLPATLVTLSVVTTGNHFLVDALAGAAISVAAYAIVDACSQRRSEGPWLRATIQAARNYRAAARTVYNHRGPSTLKSRSESPSSTHTEGRVDLTFVQNSMLGQLPVQARDDRPPVFADQPSTIEEVGLR